MGPMVVGAATPGQIAPEVIRDVTLAHLGEVNACHEAGLQTVPDGRGRVTVRYVIGSEGRVLSAEVASSTHPLPAVAVCIASTIRSWQFSPPTGGAVTVQYPFDLQPAQGPAALVVRPQGPPVAAPAAPASAGNGQGLSLDAYLAMRQEQFAPGMTPVLPTAYGTLETSRAQNYAVPLAPGRCYKIIGVGGQGVEDLDLKLYDPRNAVVDQDIATDNFPVIGLQRPLCPATAMTFRLEVIMYAGRGPYAVRVFSGAAERPAGPSRSGVISL
jgi:TonB family protein